MTYLRKLGAVWSSYPVMLHKFRIQTHNHPKTVLIIMIIKINNVIFFSLIVNIVNINLIVNVNLIVNNRKHRNVVGTFSNVFKIQLCLSL